MALAAFFREMIILRCEPSMDILVAYLVGSELIRALPTPIVRLSLTRSSIWSTSRCLRRREAAIDFSIARQKPRRETSRALDFVNERWRSCPLGEPAHAREVYLKLPASPRTRKVSLIESDLYPHALRLISARRLILMSR